MSNAFMNTAIFTAVIPFVELYKKVGDFGTKFLITRGYIDGSLKVNSDHVQFNVGPKDREAFFEFFGEPVPADPLAMTTWFQALNMSYSSAPKKGQHFNWMTPIMSSVDLERYLDQMMEIAKSELTKLSPEDIDWTKEGLHLDFESNVDQDYDAGYAEGTVSIKVNQRWNIDVSFIVEENGEPRITHDFHGETFFDTKVKVVRITERTIAIVVTVFAGGQSAEVRFFG